MIETLEGKVGMKEFETLVHKSELLEEDKVGRYVNRLRAVLQTADEDGRNRKESRKL